MTVLGAVGVRWLTHGARAQLVYISTLPAQISSSERVSHAVPRIVLTDTEALSGAQVLLISGRSVRSRPSSYREPGCAS